MNICSDKVSKFNEQTAPLISILQQLDGVQLAPQLLEPNILTAVRGTYSYDTLPRRTCRFSENAEKLMLQEGATAMDSKGKLPALGGRPTFALPDQKSQV